MDRLKMISNHVTSLVNQIPSTSTLILQISRPEAFNALNFNITYYIIQELEKARKSSKPVVITGIQKRFFGSGGDLRLVTQRYLENPEFMRSLHHMFYLTSLIEKSISFWTGYAIGSSAGLACSCKTRVALPSSKYSMPENGIGVFPNVGASYFLSHFVEKPIGLYISLTGIMLNGVDCYVLGLCNYFVYEESYEQIIEECRFEDPLQVVKKYHRTPDIELSDIWQHKNDIRDCFENAKSVEDIFARLSKKNNTWAIKTLEDLNSLCPLSLKVAFEAFKRGSRMSLREDLEMEYNIDMSMMVQWRYNFLNGVTTKLDKKKFTDWVPGEIEEVTQEMVNLIFDNPAGLRSDLRFID